MPAPAPDITELQLALERSIRHAHNAYAEGIITLLTAFGFQSLEYTKDVLQAENLFIQGYYKTRPVGFSFTSTAGQCTIMIPVPGGYSRWESWHVEYTGAKSVHKLVTKAFKIIETAMAEEAKLAASGKPVAMSSYTGIHRQLN